MIAGFEINMGDFEANFNFPQSVWTSYYIVVLYFDVQYLYRTFNTAWPLRNHENTKKKYLCCNRLPIPNNKAYYDPF